MGKPNARGEIVTAEMQAARNCIASQRNALEQAQREALENEELAAKFQAERAEADRILRIARSRANIAQDTAEGWVETVQNQIGANNVLRRFTRDAGNVAGAGFTRASLAASVAVGGARDFFTGNPSVGNIPGNVAGELVQDGLNTIEFLPNGPAIGVGNIAFGAQNAAALLFDRSGLLSAINTGSLEELTAFRDALGATNTTKLEEWLGADKDLRRRLDEAIEARKAEKLADDAASEAAWKKTDQRLREGPQTATWINQRITEIQSGRGCQ